ncbi:MAG: hypothetical protein PHU03_06855, partial [Syntrophales bacterium]|nr:hypothetical protein [Syntrophales bacterium]
MTQKNHDHSSVFTCAKLLCRILLFAIAVLSVILLALTWTGPFLVERILTGYMERAGLERPKVRVESITPRGIHLSGLQAQDGRLSVDFVSIHVSPSGLRRGKADHIAASGFNWQISLGDGKADLGLPDLEAGGSSQGPLIIPFRSLMLDSSSIIIDYEGVPLRIPFSLLLESTGDNILKMTARCKPLGIPMDIEGLGDLSSGAATLHARVSSVRNLWGYVSEERAKAPLISGSLDINATWNRGPGVAGWGKFDLYAEAKNLFFSVFNLSGRLDEGSFRALGGINENRIFEELAAGLLIRGLSFMDYNLESMDIILDELGTSSSFSARLDTPFKATIAANGTHPSIQRILEKRESFEGIFDWEITGEIPGELASRYSGPMAAIEGILPLQAEGTISLHIPSWPEWIVEARILKSMAGPLPILIAGQGLRLEGVYALVNGDFRADRNGLAGNLSSGSLLGIEKVIPLDNTMPMVIDALEIGPRDTRSLA